MKILQTIKVNKIPAHGDYKSHFGHESEYRSTSFIPFLHDSMLQKSLDSKSNIKVLNNKKTANVISFGGLSFSQIQKIKTSGLWKFLNAKWFEKFIAKADASQTLFDAFFALFLTCALRPAVIMAQANDKNRNKNKKAASHSISSGIIGYGFAKVVFSPVKNAIDKIKAHPGVFANKAEKFFRYADKYTNKSLYRTMSASKRMQTYTMLFNKTTEVLTAGVRSAITIGMIPYIDKYILNPLFGSKEPVSTKKELQMPSYKYSYIVNFKNNQESNRVFQNFTGGIK